jgi:NADP-dependent 3-hydroxy acid dehydrogenase YdfG
MTNQAVVEASSPANEGMRTLAGKCILVTGGTTGIGRATARMLANQQARVLIYGRHQEDLDSALNELQDCNTEVAGLTADQSRPEDVERVFQQVDDRLGGLDILINNAADSSHSVADTDPAEWMYIVQANLIGYMLCCHHAIPRMRQRGSGQIVNVGSMSAKICEEGSDVYVATKAGIRGFSDSLGKSLADSHINVTLMEPGLVESDLSKKSPEEIQKAQEEMRMLQPEDIARAIVFVLSQPTRCSIPLIQVRPIMQKI